MAEHAVHVELPQVEILNRDLVVSVHTDGGMLGRLTISRGGIGWFPSQGQQERHLPWERFDRLVKMEFGES
jgi:hypothetical protein